MCVVHTLEDLGNDMQQTVLDLEGLRLLLVILTSFCSYISDFISLIFSSCEESLSFLKLLRKKKLRCHT